MATDDSTGSRRRTAPTPDKLLSPKADDATQNRSHSDSSRISALMGAIEDERERLMTVESLLACVLAAMESYDAGDPDGPYYPGALEIAREILNESLDKLDATRLKPLILELTTRSA